MPCTCNPSAGEAKTEHLMPAASLAALVISMFREKSYLKKYSREQLRKTPYDSFCLHTHVQTLAHQHPHTNFLEYLGFF